MEKSDRSINNLPTTPNKFNSLLKNFLKAHRGKLLGLLLGSVTIAAGGSVYTYNKVKNSVYSSTRTDTPVGDKAPKEATFRGSVEYGIDDPEQFGTNFLLDMIAGKVQEEDLRAFIEYLGYTIDPEFSFPEINKNPALYQALWKLHILCNSPKYRVVSKDGSYKHLSHGKGGYIDHFSHTIYHYYGLMHAPAMQLETFTNKHRENFQSDFLYFFVAELSHTYALGQYSDEYIKKALVDMLPGVSLINDENPTIFKKKYATVTHYEELYEIEKDTINKICTKKTIKYPIFHETLKPGYHRVPFLRNYFLSTDQYMESYENGFEGRIHNVIEPLLVNHFITLYQEHIAESTDDNLPDVKSVDDFRRILKGELGLWKTHKRYDAILQNFSECIAPDSTKKTYQRVLRWEEIVPFGEKDYYIRYYDQIEEDGNNNLSK